MIELLSKLAGALSCNSVDNKWQDICIHSFLVRAGNSIKQLYLNNIYDVIANKNQTIASLIEFIGSRMQNIAFFILLALCFALSMKQFAQDKWGLAAFIILGFLFSTIGNFLCKQDTKYNGTVLDAVVLAYLGTNIIATFSSHYFAASCVGLAKLVVYIIGYFFFLEIFKSRKRMITVISCLVIAGLAVAIYGLYQFKIGVAPLATWEDPNVEMKATRIYSTLGNPNLLAGYLLPILPLSAALTALAFLKRKIWLGILLLVSVFTFAASIILTGSRGGYIGLIAVFGILFLMISMRIWKNYSRFRVIIFGSLLLLPVFTLFAFHFVPGLEQRVMSIFAGGEHTSNRFRLNVWKSSLHMLADNWWLGVGPGNQAFILAYGLYMTSGFDALGTYCLPLEIAVESGMLGLLVFGLLICISLARTHINYYESKDITTCCLSAGLSAAIIALMAHGLVDTVFFRPQVQIIFWIIIAAISAQCRKNLLTDNKLENLG